MTPLNTMVTITQDDVLRVAASVGFDVPAAELADYTELLQRAQDALAAVEASDDYQPVPNLEATPRTNVHRPTSDDNPFNAWAWRCRVEHTSPTSSLLKGKTVCLKDNIALAGVPCLVGTDCLPDVWVPTTDATVATRVLAHGGIIAGKAVCENLSRGAISCTAATGPVHNPYAHGHSCGGSSSGTGALVAGGVVDIGIGCDQGGSIRIPAALCGLYGFKATTGLVPYTGIASHDASVDYVGPMTKTAKDCATLLQALAGADGLDDRQGAGTPFPDKVPLYSELVSAVGVDACKGLRVGVLAEGLGNGSPAQDPGVVAAFRAAVDGLAALGAAVVDVSVPMHTRGRSIYTVMSKMANHMGMLGQATGRRQVQLTDLMALKKDSDIAKMNIVSKEGLLAGALGWDRHPLAYNKAVNLMRQLRDAYDACLEEVDIIVMPTTLAPSPVLPPVDASPLQHLRASAGLLENASVFNGTGHPAMAMPIGMVPSAADKSVMLPASMQLVGKFFDEAHMLQVAYAWETTYDWKKLQFEGSSA
ncbi:hypothetical protein SBRCBS47491_000772 [Sporothrix bragantina]|uniref:Amidase domain-containing protein n=1 Tax=Sporothrix bragantina TaxID=671064 RepID=A0ABP0AT30_9PEZI